MNSKEQDEINGISRDVNGDNLQINHLQVKLKIA